MLIAKSSHDIVDDNQY